MIITIGGIKGGSGKTTVATNLVIWLSQQGGEILLIDTDPQQTATEFTIQRQEHFGTTHCGYSAIRLHGANISREVPKLQTKYSYIVIDSGGSDTASQRAALLICDLYLIPMNPRSFDIWTVNNVEELVTSARLARLTEFEAYFFINRADARGAKNVEAGELLKHSEVVNFNHYSLGNRIAFADASGSGLSVIELKDTKATSEINNLFTSLIILKHATLK